MKYISFKRKGEETMKRINTNNVPAAIGPYSQAIEHDNIIYVSGQLPVNPETGEFAEGGIGELTKQSIRNISAILDEAGSSIGKVLKTTIYLQDMRDFSEVNEAYAEFFGETAPARACMQVAALPKGARIEIEAVAYQ